MRGTAELQEAALIAMSVKPELAIGGKLMTMTALAPFGCREKTRRIRRQVSWSGKVVWPRFPDETTNDEQELSVSSLDFNFLNSYEVATATLGGTTEPAEEGTTTMEPYLSLYKSKP